MSLETSHSFHICHAGHLYVPCQNIENHRCHEGVPRGWRSAPSFINRRHCDPIFTKLSREPWLHQMCECVHAVHVQLSFNRRCWVHHRPECSRSCHKIHAQWEERTWLNANTKNGRSKVRPILLVYDYCGSFAQMRSKLSCVFFYLSLAFLLALVHFFWCLG